MSDKFGLAQAKPEGEIILYDPEGFDYAGAVMEKIKIRSRWFQTKKRKKRISDLETACSLWLKWVTKR